MGKVLKMILLPLLLVSILSLPIALGCNGDKADTSGELSQLELEQILTDSTLLVNSVDSYKVTMDMDMFMDISSGGEEGTMDMDMTMEGAVDQKNMEMQIVMEMNMAMDMGGDRESIDDMVMDMYLVGDYIYMRMSIPEMGDEWMKMPATEENLASWDMNILEQQMIPLESPGELTFRGYENIDGSECYVIQFVPDMASMMEWMSEQDLAGMGFSWEDADMISDIFDELTYTCWIDKETGYMKKMTAYMLMKLSGSTLRDLTGESGSVTMDMNIDMEMYDYNKPVNVNLPDEALDAMEFGDSGF